MKIYRFKQVMPKGKRKERSNGYAVQVQGNIQFKR